MSKLFKRLFGGSDASSTWQMGLVGILWIILQPIFAKMGWTVDEESFRNVIYIIGGMMGIQFTKDVVETAKGNKTDPLKKTD